MDDLTPVTRTERLLDGEDLTPTNREEMFIKRIYDKTQEIPEPVNRKEYFLKKAGEAGGDVTVVPLSVTDNGTYSEEGKAYTPVNVAVEGYALKALATPSEVASFNAAELPLNKLKVGINAVQSGSGEPSPTNIRPISGWDAANVSDVGKNIVEDKISGKNISSDGIIVSQSNYDVQIAKVVQGVTYTFTTDDTAKVCAFYSSKPINGSASYNSARQTGNSTVTAPITGYIAFRTNANYAYAQCEVGQTATSYEPYNPDSYTTTISLPQTVYGGELDVVNGVLKLTHKIKVFDGVTNPFIITNDGVLLVDNAMSDGKADELISNQREYGTIITGAKSAINYPNKLCVQALNGIRLALYDANYTTAEDFNTFLASNPMQVCYELAEPIIINLTPTLIKSLNGQNNLSVDTGEVMECEWFESL